MYKKFILPVFVLIIVTAFHIVVRYFLDSDMMFYNFMNKATIVFIIVAFTWLLIKIVRTGKHILLKRYNIQEKDNLRARKLYTQFNIFEKIIVVIIIFISLASMLMMFESVRELGVSLFASAGVAGIIIGLAAQRIIAMFLAGIQIAITQPIRLDDVVIVENEWGRIEEINLTYVVVVIWDKRRLIVPSTYFIEKPFQNWTRVTAEILGTVFIYTDYTISFSAIRDKLTELLNSSPDWDGQVNVVQVTNTTESTVEIRALMSAKDSPTAWNLRVFIREKLIEFIRDNYPESLPKTRIRMHEEKAEELS